jgi:LIVCS family branched-chain amino acid:cation transporter
MKKIKKHSPFFVGLALFSMFFGSGNLTFPLYIGQISKGQWKPACFGFVISAVLLPFLGVVAMVINNGNTKKFFATTGKFIGGKHLIPIFLTIWIPLGSAPRCITVAHANFVTYIPSLSLWFFSLIYSSIIFFLTYKRKKLLDILGYFLTPLLLLLLLILIISGFLNKSESITTAMQPQFIFKGIFEGYYTMDLIAACFFSSSIINLIKESRHPKTEESLKVRLSLLLKSSIVGIMILGLVYVGLIILSASNADKIQGLEKEQILSYLSFIILGGKFGILSSIIVLLACITTSTVLVIIYTDYLKSLSILSKYSNATILFSVIVITYFLSLIGFSGITNIFGPFLQVLYPILIILVFITIIKKGIYEKSFK